MYLINSTPKYIWTLLILVPLLIPCISLAGQNDPLQIIDLKNRPADEIIPVIKPMLKPSDAITGTGFQLFLRTDAKTLEEVTRLLQVMDKAPRNLVIKVRNNLDSASKSTDFNTSGNYDIGDDVKVVVGDRPPKDKGTKVRINSNRNSTDRDTEHMIRVIEGGQAFIAAGEIRPYEHRTIIKHRYGVSVYDSVDYQDVTSGFYITPRLTGNNRVSLHVQPHYRTINEERSGTVDVQEVDTTLETRLGEWVQIGGVDTDAKSKDGGILSTSRNSSSIRSEIYIKVDLE
ncbi:MAG: hypothetical protein GKR92_04190 [Gammaproteobacteria bacterium]|nr:MAG: hypothetical protein GKR92_04190 [Gammaproteobacteria bacterium]